jgi:hypothetical protein
MMATLAARSRRSAAAYPRGQCQSHFTEISVPQVTACFPRFWQYLWPNGRRNCHRARLWLRERPFAKFCGGFGKPVEEIAATTLVTTAHPTKGGGLAATHGQVLNLVEKLTWSKQMGWHHNDLTVAAGAPLPSVDEGISAYAFEDQGTQHVIYFGQDDHIRELWWDNNGWHHNDLTVAAGAPLPSENISAYPFEDQGTQHVIYFGQDFHIQELWWDNAGWHHNDLTVAAGAPLPGVDQGMSGYAFEDQGTQHVIYVGQDLHINELWWAPD